jgi:uncharacterized protein YlxP (DUF503 family)
MHVGLLILEIRLPGCDTLKEKRHRLKGVIERTRSKFNVSVSEVGRQDAHQDAQVGISMVSTERRIIERAFTKVEEYFAEGDGLVIIESGIEWF